MSKERDEAKEKYMGASGNKDLFDNESGSNNLPPFWVELLWAIIIFGGSYLAIKIIAFIITHLHILGK